MENCSSKAAWLALAAFALSAVAMTPCLAQISQQDFVKLHNAARDEVGVGRVTWDDTVAAWAQSYAEQRRSDCALEHSPSGRPYGENIAAGPAGADMSASTVVGMWVNEKQYYHHDTNSCSAPMDQSCGHYTQVVWRDTTTIGCASVACNKGGTFVICSYNPPGNVANQSPY
jgi:pathogenesis-related protein 1